MVDQEDKVMQQLIQVLKEETQLKLSQILRHTNYRQYYGHYGIGNTVCALGAIARYFGWDGDYNPRSRSPSEIVESVIPEQIVRDQIISMNDDSRKTFSEIADWLEERGL